MNQRSIKQPRPLWKRITVDLAQSQICWNIFWLFFDKGIRIVVALVVTAWMARYLGPAPFGQLSFAIAFVSLFAVLATLGLQDIVVRDLVRDANKKEEILGTAFLLQLIGAITSVITVIFSISLLRSNDSTAMVLVAIISFSSIFHSSSVIKYWFESQVQSRFVVWAENLVILAMSAFRIALIINDAPLIAFVWAILFESMLSACALIAIYLSATKPLIKTWTASSSRAKVLLKDSWPLLLSGVAIMVYMRIDQIMLGQMIGEEAVGIYSAALRISEVWYMVPMVVSASLFPSILQAKGVNENLYFQKIQRLLDSMVTVAIAIALIISFASSSIVENLFGKEFVSAAQVLRIHIWSGLFVFMGVVSSKWLIAEGLQCQSLYRTSLGCGVNIVLNLYLIPILGPSGAALATFISQIVAAYVFDLFSSSCKPMFIMKTRAIFCIPLLLSSRRV